MEFIATIFVIVFLMSIFGDQIIEILGFLLIGILLLSLILIMKKCFTYYKFKSGNRSCNLSPVSENERESENKSKKNYYENKKREEAFTKSITGDYFVKGQFFSDGDRKKYYCIHEAEHFLLDEPCCNCARRKAGPCETWE